MDVLIDAISEDGTAIGRSAADAPEIDGTVRIARAADLAVGSMVEVDITQATAHDLVGRRTK
jgi:ribosomal protein S12 methylthiotransferase